MTITDETAALRHDLTAIRELISDPDASREEVVRRVYELRAKVILAERRTAIGQ